MNDAACLHDVLRLFCTGEMWEMAATKSKQTQLSALLCLLGPVIEIVNFCKGMYKTTAGKMTSFPSDLKIYSQQSLQKMFFQREWNEKRLDIREVVEKSRERRRRWKWRGKERGWDTLGREWGRVSVTLRSNDRADSQGLSSHTGGFCFYSCVCMFMVHVWYFDMHCQSSVSKEMHETWLCLLLFTSYKDRGMGKTVSA